MKTAHHALVALSLVTLASAAHAATKGEQAGRVNPAAVARATDGATTAHTMGKLGPDHAVAVAAKGRPGYVLLVRGNAAIGRLSPQQAADQAAPGRFAVVTAGDGSGRGLPTITDKGLRVSADGRNQVISVRGGRLVVRRDAATAKPPTEAEVREAAYFRWLNTGNADATANWLGAEAQMKDGR